MSRTLLAIFVIGFGFLGTSGYSQTREATLLQHREQIRITPLGTLNSPYRETNLSVTPDGRFLYFMSLRGGQYWSHMYMTWGSDSVYDGDIWFSEKKSGVWAKPQVLPYGINTSSGEDEPNISPGGRRVFYQSWDFVWEYTGGPYYVANLGEDGKWGRRKGLGGGITEFFKTDFDATDGMTVSPDGKTFIVACGYGYDSNMDLYISRKGTHGWSYCRKLPLSTEGDERSVFLAADGRTLYFASDGYKGYGGLDIFKTVLNEDGTFGEVINLGKPFNTPGDDYGFILTGDGKEGYFIRNGDIYFADLTKADDRIKPLVGLALAGTVRDSATGRGISATVMLLDARTKRVIKQVRTNSQGKYETNLPNKNAYYDQIVRAQGYRNKNKRLKTGQSSYHVSYESNFKLAKKDQSPPPIASVAPSPPPIAEERPEEIAKPEPSTQNPPQVVQITPNRPPPVTPADTTPTIVAQPVETEKIPEKYNFENVADNNLVLLLDVSSSMRREDKLPLLKQSFKKLIKYMRQQDKISVVTYSSDAEVVLGGVSALRQKDIERALDELKSGGGTRSKNALRKAFRVAQQHFISNGNNRIILATD
ncbi:MAG: VWA domain-containing protein, partial [Bacteroidota bacterium]